MEIEELLVIRRDLIEHKVFIVNQLHHLLKKVNLVNKKQTLWTAAGFQQVLNAVENAELDKLMRAQIDVLSSIINSLNNCIDDVEQQMHKSWRT